MVASAEDIQIDPRVDDARIVFLHHSSGKAVWNGGERSLCARLFRKLGSILGIKLAVSAFVPSLLAQHNKQAATRHRISARVFPKAKPYGWHNYPFDYWNIWVKNAGAAPYLEEPTLEMLTRDFNAIIFKHCFPVSNIQPDTVADINADYRSLGNYKLQYLALREKLHQFPSTKFIVWTGAAQVQSRTKEDEAKRAEEFFNWVSSEWDLPDDNIFSFFSQTSG